MKSIVSFILACCLSGTASAQTLAHPFVFGVIESNTFVLKSVLYRHPISDLSAPVQLGNPNSIAGIFKVDADRNGVAYAMSRTEAGTFLNTISLADSTLSQQVAVSGLPTGLTLKTFAINPRSNVAMLSAIGQFSGNNRLFRMDLASGIVTEIGNGMGNQGNFGDLAIACSGKVYALYEAPFNMNRAGALYEVRADGTTTLVGPLGLNITSLGGMDFDNETGVLYYYSDNGGFYTLSTATGQAMLVAPTQLVADAMIANRCSFADGFESQP